MIPVLGNRNRRGVSLPHKRNPLLLCLPRIPMIQVSFDLLKPLRLLFTDSLNNIRLAVVTGGQWELSILNALQKRATGPCLFSNSMPIMQINCHGCVAKGPITELELIPYVIFILKKKNNQAFCLIKHLPKSILCYAGFKRSRICLYAKA